MVAVSWVVMTIHPEPSSRYCRSTVSLTVHNAHYQDDSSYMDGREKKPIPVPTALIVRISNGNWMITVSLRRRYPFVSALSNDLDSISDRGITGFDSALIIEIGL